MRIGLISDTHGWLEPKIATVFSNCDEIWHAGDIGDDNILTELAAIAPTRAVFGNILTRIVNGAEVVQWT